MWWIASKIIPFVGGLTSKTRTYLLLGGAICAALLGAYASGSMHASRAAKLKAEIYNYKAQLQATKDSLKLQQDLAAQARLDQQADSKRAIENENTILEYQKYLDSIAAEQKPIDKRTTPHVTTPPANPCAIDSRLFDALRLR